MLLVKVARYKHSLKSHKNILPGDCSILIVDDEPSLLECYRKLLASEGYDVKAADTRASAIEILKNFDAQIILLDCRMSGMSNEEFKSKVDELLKDRVHARLIGFSSFSEDSVFATEMRGVFGEFVEKPADLDKFLDFVHSLCFPEIDPAAETPCAAAI